MATNMINHPSHYNFSSIEVIDVIEQWNLNFHLGNTIKYIARCSKKGNLTDDLNKAKWYLNRYIVNTTYPGYINICSNKMFIRTDKFYICNVLNDWKLSAELNYVLSAIYHHEYSSALKQLSDYIIVIERQKISDDQDRTNI